MPLPHQASIAASYGQPSRRGRGPGRPRDTRCPSGQWCSEAAGPSGRGATAHQPAGGGAAATRGAHGRRRYPDVPGGCRPGCGPHRRAAVRHPGRAQGRSGQAGTGDVGAGGGDAGGGRGALPVGAPAAHRRGTADAGRCRAPGHRGRSGRRLRARLAGSAGRIRRHAAGGGFDRPGAPRPVARRPRPCRRGGGQGAVPRCGPGAALRPAAGPAASPGNGAAHPAECDRAGRRASPADRRGTGLRT